MKLSLETVSGGVAERESAKVTRRIADQALVSLREVYPSANARAREICDQALRECFDAGGDVEELWAVLKQALP
jgi:hypothetical protein